MNSKERVRCAIGHRQPDRVPIDYHARGEITSALMAHLGLASEERLREVLGVDLLHWPIWVYYYERQPGRLDIRVLDAVTGSKPGPRVRVSLLDAFAAAKKKAP